MPTILDLQGLTPPAEVQGTSVLRDNDREAVIFGYFGGAVNVTDGRTSYHRYPADVAARRFTSTR